MNMSVNQGLYTNNTSLGPRVYEQDLFLGCLEPQCSGDSMF